MKEVKTNIFKLIKNSRDVLSLHIPLGSDYLHRITSNGATLFEGSLLECQEYLLNREGGAK